MKLTNTAAVFLSLAPVQSARVGSSSSSSFTHSSSSSSTSAWSATPSPTNNVDSGVPICGAGFTYCGYILRDHQNFKEEDIIKAYCASHKGNCVNGKTKTDPIQALYVCVPPNAAPVGDQFKKKKLNNHATTWRNTAIDDDYDDIEEEEDAPTPNYKKPISPRYWQSPWQNNNNLLNNLLNQPQNHRQAHSHTHSSSASSSVFESTTTVTATQSWSQSPSPGSPSPNGGGGGGPLNNNSSSSVNTCSSAAVPGNKIELLCSCSGQCLNPISDHIGRCDIPCS